MSEVVVKQAQTDIFTTKSSFGFWIYLMTDCMLFGSLFATFMVLRGNTAGGPSGHDIFSLPYVFVETAVLLISSYACGLALLAARAGKVRPMKWLVVLTGLLGAVFLAMELYEFNHLVAEGHSWTRSGFLSSYFGLVGTHGLHITVGLIWLAAMLGYMWRREITPRSLQRLTMFSMFWHFLDIVWICIFTIVYLLGVIS